MPDIPRLAEPVHGRGLLDGLPVELLERPLVLTQPEPWALVGDHFEPERTHVDQVAGMESERLEARTQGYPEASAVFGIGGGTALDAAKYYAWRRDRPLVLMPSILSVDAAYTRAIGIRDAGRVRYVGEVVPDHLLVDFDLIQAAEPVLNRAGVGDLLSIFTAVWDWRQAHERLGEAYDPQVAAHSSAILQRVLAEADAIRAVDERGLETISHAYLDEVRLCEQIGNARPEEGSEHTLAYCLEARTGRGFLHGRLIGLCVLLTGLHQGQAVEPLAAFLEAIALDCSPELQELTWRQVEDGLCAVGDYAAAEAPLPGVFHFTGNLDRARARALCDQVRDLIR